MQGLGSGDLGRDRPAFAEHDPEGEVAGSISNERTFREDVTDLASIEAVLCGLGERVCWRAHKCHVKARTETLKLRYADFHTLTRSHTMMATNSELESLSHRQGDVRGGANDVDPGEEVDGVDELAVSALGPWAGACRQKRNRRTRERLRVDLD